VLSTSVFTVLGLATVYIAVFAFSAINSISAFVLVMLVTITPWMAIMLVGFAIRRGEYFHGELLNLNGRYRFTAGINPRAFAAFIPAAVVGFLFSSTEIYTGPLVAKVDGLDLSYTSAFLIAAGIYVAAVKLFPETASSTEPAATPVESVAAGDVAGI
jgi:purine-cytosine permease-like protein